MHKPSACSCGAHPVPSPQNARGDTGPGQRLGVFSLCFLESNHTQFPYSDCRISSSVARASGARPKKPSILSQP